eukprot:scaffold50608_cov37-Phaeocystis_antarctica.AAC.3
MLQSRDALKRRSGAGPAAHASAVTASSWPCTKAGRAAREARPHRSSSGPPPPPTSCPSTWWRGEGRG